MMNSCPCQSKKTYLECCARFITSKAHPEDAETLMRSRYTAYTLADMGYIKNTMSGKALLGFDADKTKRWAQSVFWLGLEVIDSQALSDADAYVEFVASYLEAGSIKKIHEKSIFKKINGQWLYLDGEFIDHQNKAKKVSRNSPCPCQSGKKFKNCHGR
jgi:SEC-C motif-containing protein